MPLDLCDGGPLIREKRECCSVVMREEEAYSQGEINRH